jgi:hypothetical protein
MGQSARSRKSRSGKVVGVITGKLDEPERGWRGCTELQIVELMHERRRRMMDLGDACIVLPGGLGTCAEFFEVLVACQLGDHVKPIVIVNQDRYYEPLIAMIDHGIEDDESAELSLAS